MGAMTWSRADSGSSSLAVEAESLSDSKIKGASEVNQGRFSF